MPSNTYKLADSDVKDDGKNKNDVDDVMEEEFVSKKHILPEDEL